MNHVPACRACTREVFSPWLNTDEWRESLLCATCLWGPSPTTGPSPGLCPATSPESARPCALPDTRDAHAAGHESARDRGVTACWATTPDDRARWAAHRAREAGLAAALAPDADRDGYGWPPLRPPCSAAAAATTPAEKE